MQKRLSRSIGLLSLIALSLTLFGFEIKPTQAATITVTTLADEDDGSLGLGTGDSLREAILYSATGDDIIFSVTGTITLNSGQIIIDKDLIIQGPGAANLTISGNNTTRIFFIDSGTTANISGLTIANGSAISGSGIYNDGTLTVTDSTLSGNFAFGFGGGIHNTGTLNISNSTLTGNSANGGGGIFNNASAALVVDGSTLSTNSAPNGGGIFNDGTLTVTDSTLSGNVTTANGGGIFNNGVTLEVSNTTLSGNSAANGGGIFNEGTLTVTDSTLSSNSANNGYGGGLVNAGTLTVSSSTLSGNSANFNGGGLSNNSGTTTISTSTLSGNSAANGGGIYNLGTVTVDSSLLSGNSTPGNGGGLLNGSTMILSNSTLSGNSANNGGGLLNGGTLTVSNSTLSGNSADGINPVNSGNGGGILNNSGNLTLINSTLSGNLARNPFGSLGGGLLNRATITRLSNTIIANSPSGGDCANSGLGTITTSNNNIIENGACGGAAGDPVLGPLQDNGGPTFTHALIAGSPAIDTGNGCEPADQRGVTRDTPCDIGAYELVKPVFVFTTTASNVTEGSPATPEVQMQVSPLGVYGLFTVTVSYPGGSALNSTDYTPDPTVSFDCTTGCTTTQSSTTQANGLSIATASDSLLENPETVDLALTNPVNATLGTPTTHTLTINDNTTALASLAAVTNGAEPATPGQFSVNLSATNATGAPITVSYSVNPASTATAGVDYTALAGSVIIPDGAASTLIAVNILDDLLLEGSESVSLTLTGSSLGSVTVEPASATAALTITDDEIPPTATPIASPTMPPAPLPVSDTGSAAPALGIFDPALSKIGFLLPGQVGVTGEQLEWIITVTNNGTAAGTNIQITDTVDSRLQVDRVVTPVGQAIIAGQKVVITLPTLAPGQTVQFSIFTTVLRGVSVSNTACLTADNTAPRCTTGLAVQQLPATGEGKWWRTPFLVGLLLLTGLALVWIGQRRSVFSR